jgi:putative glycosyltransferase (TIGR04372 family)
MCLVMFHINTRMFKTIGDRLNFIKIYRTITVMGVIRLGDALKRTFGIIVARLVIYVIRIIANTMPIALINYLPRSICSLFGSSALENNFSKVRCFAWANRAAQSRYSGHRKVAFFIKANYFYKTFNAEISDKLIKQELHRSKASTEFWDFFRTWSWHNNSQINHSKLIKQTIANLQVTDNLFNQSMPHYLPEHTTNMGHLGALFLYSNYYRRIEPSRHIAIWPELSPNKYYLNELLKILPFKIKLMSENFSSLKIAINQIDTLSYSRVKEGHWKYESLSDIPINQDFPEYLIQDDFKLESSLQLNDHVESELLKLGFDSNKWFVCLHVKENKSGYTHGGESRDASIESYFEACSEICSLGGQVIRMGGKNFPRLSEKFPAIDYAHSPVKSEKLDYWLWANCKFWVGTPNGASIAVIPFRKPRLLTNTWPMNPIGPSTDFFLPKLIYDVNRKKLLTPSEIVHHKLSRSMKRHLFAKEGFTLVDNSSKLICEAVVEFNVILDKANNVKVLYSEYENEVYSAMEISLNTQKMRIPKSFAAHVEESLLSLNRSIKF